jgi:hypothetical protein
MLHGVSKELTVFIFKVRQSNKTASEEGIRSLLKLISPNSTASHPTTPVPSVMPL